MKKSVKIILGAGILIIGIAIGFSTSTLVNKSSGKHGGPGERIEQMAASGGAIGGSEDSGRPQRPGGDGGSGGNGKKGAPPQRPDGDNSEGEKFQ